MLGMVVQNASHKLYWSLVTVELFAKALKSTFMSVLRNTLLLKTTKYIVIAIHSLLENNEVMAHIEVANPVIRAIYLFAEWKFKFIQVITQVLVPVKYVLTHSEICMNFQQMPDPYGFFLI